MKTERETVTVRDIILPSVQFETPEFKAVHNWFKSLVVDTAIDSEKEMGIIPEVKESSLVRKKHLFYRNHGH